MWWIAVHLPALSLESFVATLPRDVGTDTAARLDLPEPVLLLERQRVTAANEAAAARGIVAGQRRATAMALAPGAHCGEADPARDAAALDAVACALLAFTPAVSLDGVDTVLAEVATTLRYFGGGARLLAGLREALAPLGHRVQVAVAPTPQAATWLARWRDDSQAPRSRRWLPGATRDDAPEIAESVLQARLGPVPVACLSAVDGPALAKLHALGLRTVADLARQPRDGLARRYGDALLDELDAATGRRADPREPIVPPAVFDSRLELFARAESSEALLPGAGVLLARLVAWAGSRHGRIAGFRLSLHPETRRSLREVLEGGVTTLDLSPAEPGADAAHLHGLLRERLQRLPLAAPVIELTLHCNRLVPGAPPTGELFPSASSQREGWLHLLERLEARLGADRLQQLEAVDDHRPERATRVRPGSVPAAVAAAARRPARATTSPSPSPSPSLSSASLSTATSMRARAATRADAATRSVPVPADDRQRRPAWLLSPPRPLTERQGVPCWEGQPLVLLAGPERIEAGWWDGDLVARDYFVAQAADGTLLWIYRFRHAPEGRGAGWHLQGRFG